MFHRYLIAILLPAAMIAATPTLAATPAITVSNAWIRALPASVPSGGYFTLHNSGGKTVTLVGAQSPACGMLMLHRSDDMGGMSSMSDVQTVDVSPGGSVKFAPGGFHLMCMDAKLAIKPGNTVPVTLSFQDGSKLTVTFSVKNAAGH